MEPQKFGAWDIEEMASAFQGWQMEVVQQEPGNFAGNLHGFSQLNGRINFYSASINRRVFANGHHLAGSVMFTFIECPSASTWNGERVDRLKLFVSDAERGLDLDAGKGFVSFSVSVERTLLEKWFRDEGLANPTNWNFSLDFNKGGMSGAALAFREIIGRAVYGGVFNLPVFKLAIFKAVNPGFTEHLSRISINFAAIHETVEMMHESVRIGKEINLQKALEFYGGPMRTFYYNFKKYTGCTPHQYIKNLRLSAVHKMLKISDANVVGVREIAYQ